MAVLKRFSYDNIVEHNPTAPDPVEGGGGSGGLKYSVVPSEDFAYLYMKDSEGNFVSYDQFMNDIAAVALIDMTSVGELGQVVRDYQYVYFVEISDETEEVKFFWPGFSTGLIQLIQFRAVDGKLQAAMPE